MDRSLGIVVFQLVVIWIIAIGIYVRAVRRDNRAPLDDIGIIWLGVIVLYGTLPTLFWLLLGGTYSPLSPRLFVSQPSVSEIVYLLNIVIAYVVGFGCVYLFFFRQVGRPNQAAHVLIGDSKLAAAIVVVGFTYITKFTIVQHGSQLPLGLGQLLKVAFLSSVVANMVIVIGLVQRLPRSNWLLVVYVTYLLFSFSGGDRGEAVTGFFGLTICWHVFVRPIASYKLFVGAVLGLIVFTLMGIFRELGTNDLSFMHLGEFDHLWANAVDLLQARNSGGLKVPFSVRFNDLWSFVPSQLLWFEKNSLSIWFLDNFYPAYKDMGGGFAFGAISEAVVGGGILDAAIRGGLIGGITILLMRWFRRSTTAWWHFPLHLFMLIWTFQSVRDTTFRLLGDVLQNILPAFLLITIISALLRVRQPLRNREAH